MSRGELTQPQVSHALAQAFAALRDRQDLSPSELPSEDQVERMMVASMTGQDSPEVRAFLRRWLDAPRRAYLIVQEGQEIIDEIYGE
jgi:hypothetical protein